MIVIRQTDTDLLRRVHDEYELLRGAEISWPEATLYVMKLCDEVRPNVVFDLGSGWTSFILRWKCPDAIIWSVDTSENWLQKSISFCSAHGVSTERFVMWDQVVENAVVHNDMGDLVIHDMGDRYVRMDTLTKALDLVRPGGHIVLDDMHKSDLAKHINETLNARPEFGLIDVSNETRDWQGRFMLTAVRTS